MLRPTRRPCRGAGMISAKTRNISTKRGLPACFWRPSGMPRGRADILGGGPISGFRQGRRLRFCGPAKAGRMHGSATWEEDAHPGVHVLRPRCRSLATLWWMRPAGLSTLPGHKTLFRRGDKRSASTGHRRTARNKQGSFRKRVLMPVARNTLVDAPCGLIHPTWSQDAFP